MSISTLVLLGLAIVWAIVLLPEAMKRISRVRQGDSISSFNRQLSSLQRPAQRSYPMGAANVIDLRTRAQARAPQPVRPTQRSSSPVQRVGAPAQRVGAPVPVSPAVRRRRQEVLTTLGSASVLSLLCSVAFGGPFLVLFVVCAALLVAYVVALFQVTNAPQVTSVQHHRHPARTSSPHVAAVPGIRVSPVGARRVAN